MAESILYGAVSNILSKFVLNAGKDLGLIFGLKKELEKLQGTLSTINAVLLDAEEKQESSHAVKNWISRLEDVVYDADDLLDEFDYAILRQKVLARRQVRKFFSSSNPLVFGLNMGPRIKEIIERLDSIAADISKFNLSPRVATDMKAKYTNRKTASKVRPEMIGREKDKEHVIKSLFQKHHHGDSISNIVAIVGFGGLGKTTLAQSVYNDVEIKNVFNPRIWVCVSEEFDVCIIFKKILESLGDSKIDDLDLDIYLKRLEENLRGKRYLLVLDDVWNENNLKWDNFSKHLVFGAPESKILVTTRSKNVASIMGLNSPHVLKGLNEDQSWTLFEQVAFEGQGQMDPKLKVIGKDVAQKCKGVPLVIKCLGGLMRQNPNERYWSFVQENEIWKLLKEDDGVIPVLKLSYIHLPSHLKQCFAFCSILRKDYNIPKDRLILIWRAQGYIQSQIRNENIQDIGDEYFNDLLSRSFFQEEVKDENGNIIRCKMHDLIHDLALSVAKSSFSSMKDDKEKLPKGVRHVILEWEHTNIQKEVFTHLSKVKGIRTLHFRSDISRELFIRCANFSKFNCLRILNLSFRNFRILPNSIGKLKHLRYLNLSGNYEMEVLPEAIAKLHHLQTLLLYYCSNLKKLPKHIQQLISLEYLELDLCEKLTCLPEGLRELTSLRRLDRFIVNTVEKSFSTAATLNELRDLNDLENHLGIENLDMVRNVELESMEAILREKKRLQSLRLQWGPNIRGDNKKNELLLDNLEPHPNLKELTVFGYEGARFSTWLSYLNNLIKLKIEHCWRVQHVATLPPLDHLSSLKSLTLDNLHLLKHVADHDGKEYDRSLPTASFFTSLKELKIRNCPNLKGWWRTKNENQGSTVELSWFPCLSKLEIKNSPNLTSMPLFPSLDQDLTLEGTSIRPLQETLKMKMTKASMTSEGASSSSSEITCLSYSSTTLPLSNLKCLTLIDIKDLEALPEEFLLNLTSLKTLSFSKCPELQYLPEGTHQLTSLQELCVKNCPNLRALPDWVLNLTSLETLEIQSCSELHHLPEGTHRPTSLQELHVGDCLNLKALPNWIPNLTSLKTIDIRGCDKLQYLPEGIQHLTSLRSLSIIGCPQLSERCKKETGIHWPHIAHIPYIYIEGN